MSDTPTSPSVNPQSALYDNNITINNNRMDLTRYITYPLALLLVITFTILLVYSATGTDLHTVLNNNDIKHSEMNRHNHGRYRHITTLSDNHAKSMDIHKSTDDTATGQIQQCIHQHDKTVFCQVRRMCQYTSSSTPTLSIACYNYIQHNGMNEINDIDVTLAQYDICKVCKSYMNSISDADVFEICEQNICHK